MIKTVRNITLAGVVLTAAVASHAEPFSIVALPDTQHYAINNGPGPAGTKSGQLATFEQQTQWIADNRDAYDISFVTHVGDVVERAGDQFQYVGADAAMDKLDGTQIPYSVTAGNHDFPDQKTHLDSINYERYFGQQRYFSQQYDWYGGASPSNAAHYQKFEAGGTEFLHLTLEWGAAGTSLPWAQRVIEQNPGVPTIVTTHAYLREDADGDPSNGVTPGYQPGTGDLINSYLVEPNDQVFMVLNGHYHETDLPIQERGEAHRVVQNEFGNDVIEILSDYQDRENGGNGWFRLMEFDDSADKIRVRTLNATGLPEETDANSRFDLALPDFFDESRFSQPAEHPIETVTLTDGVDTYIRASKPGESFGDDTQIEVYPITDFTDTRRQGLLKFTDIDKIPDEAKILSAVLKVKTSASGDGAQLHRMLQAWDETATWDTFDGDEEGGVQTGDEAYARPFDLDGFPFGFANDWDASVGPASTHDDYTYIDVTLSLIDWIEKGEENHGWVLTPPVRWPDDRPFSEFYGDTFVSENPWLFWSADSPFKPELEVTYAVPEPATVALFGVCGVLLAARRKYRA